MSTERTWWSSRYRAWCRWSSDQLIVVETDTEIAARRGPMPSTVGAWIVRAFVALRGIG